jgi:hypothetical protein
MALTGIHQNGFGTKQHGVVHLAYHHGGVAEFGIIAGIDYGDINPHQIADMRNVVFAFLYILHQSSLASMEVVLSILINKIVGTLNDECCCREKCYKDKYQIDKGSFGEQTD